MNKPSVSIVIPAYNEEGHLALCLDAIARQTVRPLEVIVVDNNSTDATAAIARSYPFATVISEKRQGVVYARDCGFNAARGDIIGRLDGDSVIAPNWVESVQQIFASRSVEAVSGQVAYREIGCPAAFDAFDRRLRSYLARHMGKRGEQFLYGVNMAIRRDVWKKVAPEVCHQPHLHEDLDLACHLSRKGSKVVFEPNLKASIAGRQAAAGPVQFLRYVWSCPGTYAGHGMRSTRHANLVALLVSCFYVPIHVLSRGYNPGTQRFSLAYLCTNSTPVRSSPVSESV